MDSRNKLGVTGCIVEIDETLMRGRRKNLQGRMLIADILDYDAEHNLKRHNDSDRV